MKAVRYIAYRFLTPSDYFNIYKPPRTETSGGGQLYIDFPTAAISVSAWRSFFRGVSGLRETVAANGPKWECPVHSIGLPKSKGDVPLIVYQRRPQTVCIAYQNIHTRHASRVLAWHPEHGFPSPRGPAIRGKSPPQGLAVFLARTYDCEVWAGWFRGSNADALYESMDTADQLNEMLDAANLPGRTNLLAFEKTSLYLSGDGKGPAFSTISRDVEREPLLNRWFDEEDISTGLQDLAAKEHFRRVRDRNKKATQELKLLYMYRCQITGNKFAFPTKDGTSYVEAHHLIPLGNGGADDAHNIIIVSAHIHRMLHYAHVDPFDLSKIHTDIKGWGVMSITIGDSVYQIRWHPKHMDVVRKYQVKRRRQLS